jgi:pyruvate formate-lyase/glycerol dehydratase family glycyl radical enzyme
MKGGTILNLQLSKRNRTFRNALIDTTPTISAERARIVTKVYQEHEHLTPIAKAALGLKTVLEQMTIEIQDWDLIVGNQADGLRTSTINPAVNTWIVDELDRFELRDGSRFLISEKTKECIRRIIPYWQNKNVYDQTMALLPEDTKDSMESLVFTCGYTLSKGCGHWLVNMERVLKEGFSGIEAQARQLRSACDLSDPDGVDKIPFYDAVIMTCQAVRDFALRYHRLALEKAKIADEERRKELLEIAEICRKVPYEAPTTYHEAVQTVFFLQLLPQIESDGTGISAGRLDMFLYPFYRRDLDSGRITKAQAEELTDQLWLKIASIIQVWNEEDSKSFGGHPISQAITLGGMDELGNDNTNELSYLMLETTARVHMAQPSVCCRINRNTPDDFLSLCSEVIREGLGMPAMYNDEIAIPSLVSQGIPMDLARKYYAVIGCVEMGVQGKLCAFANSGYFNLAKTLEIMLHDGIDPSTGKTLVSGLGKLKDVSDFQSFTELYYAYMEHLLRHQVRVTNVVDTMHARLVPLPFMSAITDGCVDSGREVQSGGALFNYDGIQGVGVADVADSFLTVKKLVFEQHICTLPELVAALDADYKGYDDLWIQIRREIIRYGNNSREANELARELVRRFCISVSGYKNLRGGQFVPGMYSNSANVPLGAVVGALPNGRHAYAPIAEACSPSHGSEHEGPTQAALSVASLDHVLLTNGSQYNQKYHPAALQGEKGIRSLSQLIRTFFLSGGYHIQFNVVSSDTLRDAQKHPEQYRDLVVRVAGYTAFFTDLNKDIQNDIIDRTEMDFAL